MNVSFAQPASEIENLNKLETALQKFSREKVF